jgi:predicted unusual protein kinase regulating ubiquinone biosynthesis (AarF/ABC1/UbiB family)
LGHFGLLAGGVASGMMLEGARRFADGERPRISDLLLTPSNFGRITDRLSHLRGAAMKLGQMISMDAGDILPPELTEIMARLRQDAYRMPPKQLQQLLSSQWGKDWRTRFARFDAAPIASASIGQVHRAQTRDGRDLAIKVQYPGVRASIDADVDNVAALLRLSGLLPRDLDVAPLLDAAKAQLREEADYVREGQQIALFGKLLADAPDYVVPVLDTEFTTPQVLAMSFIDALPIETLIDAPQKTRDAAMRSLIALTLRELFEFGVMQTDPNFGNYRYQPSTNRLVLLDFGASRPVAAETSAGYRELLRATISGDLGRARDAALAAGFIGQAAITRHPQRIDRMIDAIIGKMRAGGAFDFGDRELVATMRDEGMVVAADRAAWHVPPAGILFVQRKVSGAALLAARMKARIYLRPMFEAYL